VLVWPVGSVLVRDLRAIAERHESLCMAESDIDGREASRAINPRCGTALTSHAAP